MPYDKILAKSDPEKTLIQHTQDCFEKFRQVIIWKKVLISSVCERYKLNESEFKMRLFLTVAFHDIGKATVRFQEKVRGNQLDGPESHALTSVLFIYRYTAHKPILHDGKNHFLPECLAIASHHGKLRKGLFEANHKNMKVAFVESIFFETFFNVINSEGRQLFSEDWNELEFDPTILNKNQPYLLFCDEVVHYIPSFTDSLKTTEKIRDIFLLFKSVLHYSDWLASSEYRSYQYTSKENYSAVTAKMKDKVKSFKSWLPFQDKAAMQNDHIFVQIPTGQGKTEAALLWALNQQSPQKILFLLPTMVTTNKMYGRMLHFFEKEEIVGLSHGTAQYVLKEEHQEWEKEDLRKHYLYNRTFFKPVTVATVDQLIYSFFNWGYWVLTGVTSYNARIVVDEIHIYDAYTFGLLLKIIEVIRPYNTQFAIMSASLPEVLRVEIEKILPEYTLIKDSSFDSKQRHVLSIFDGSINDKVLDIFSDYDKDLKVLVVCNTIRKAREIYDELLGHDDVSEVDMMLYHSQFILLDKNEKEKLLEDITSRKGGYIAICTQIVEVSLDIDFDVLYTENAPIDAIIQRLGRVNRKGKIQERIPHMQLARVVITRESETSRKYVYGNLDVVLEEGYQCLQEYVRSFSGHLQERHFKEIVDKVYTRENLGQDYFNQLDEAKTLISRLWKEFVKGVYTLDAEQRQLEKISSRKTTSITYECVLQVHNSDNKFYQFLENKKFDEIRRFTVKIPVHYAKKYQAIPLDKGVDIYLIDLEYDEKRGITYGEPQHYEII